jgi:hypothetical protein
MFDPIFIFKLLLTFLVGSIWITGTTVIAEKFGSKVGGVIGGLPSTIVIALFFIGWTQSPLVAAASTVVIPIIMGIDALFILTYTYVSRFHISLAILASLLVWFVLSLSLVLIHFESFAISLLCSVLLLGCSYIVMEYLWHIKSVAGRAYAFTVPNLILRGVISGSIIAIAVALAKLGGPLVGGVFASFPAVFLSTMIITYLAQGRAFSVSVLKIMMISGTISVTIYAIAVRLFYPTIGLILGTLASFLISLASAYLIYLLTKKLA